MLSTPIPASALMGVGFAFPNGDAMWPAMDGAVGKTNPLDDRNTNLVPFERVWDNGLRQIIAVTRPIKTPDDLRSVKIRAPVVALWVFMFAALKAAPTSIPLSEVYRRSWPARR